MNNFVSIGFRKALEFTGLMAKGSIGIVTRIKTEEDRISPEVIQLYHENQIEPGMSGAPVLDIERGRLIGIITERYKEEYNPSVSTMAFALTVKSMIDLYPILRRKNQGLTVMAKFLQSIGEERSSIFKWIDEVYVPPIEYDEINATLKTERIVFITGSKEYGKTFTAVRLLYEYFKEDGYRPRWVNPKGSDLEK